MDAALRDPRVSSARDAFPDTEILELELVDGLSRDMRRGVAARVHRDPAGAFVREVD